MTLDELKKHIQDFFGDTSRSAQATREGLLEASDLCQTMAESIPEDEG